ncbi:hypothetical protein SEA_OMNICRITICAL_83 [Mycobacterium phage OmniCritical]|nr:hypothetical protein SEA_OMNICRITICAL_83 [Mycobacterium phage OmniCritical]
MNRTPEQLAAINRETAMLNKILGLDRTADEREADLIRTANKAEAAVDRLIAEARAALDAGDPVEAEALTNRAEAMRLTAAHYRRRAANV